MEAIKSNRRYWNMPKTEAQRRSIDKWNATNTTRVVMNVNKNSQSDVLSQLDSVSSKQGYIISLIQNDLYRANHARVSLDGGKSFLNASDLMAQTEALESKRSALLAVVPESVVALFKADAPMYVIVAECLRTTDTDIIV